MSKDLALKVNEESLGFLGEVAEETKGDSGGESYNLPTLKINYEEDLKNIKRGQWVVGQVKNDSGEVIDEGKLVTNFIVLVVRNRYNYYNEKDTSKNCYSKYHYQNEEVYGVTHGYKCGRECPYRAVGLDIRCKAQKVAFGIAITKDNEFIDCVAFFQGTGYMPFVDILKEIQKFEVNGKLYEVPLFANVLKLSSKKEKQGAITYFVPIFERVKVITDKDTILKMKEKRDTVIKIIEAMNNAISSGSGGSDVSEAREVKDTVTQVKEEKDDNVVDITSEATVIEDVNEEKDEVKGVDSKTVDDIDIDAEIEEALKGI